MLQNNISILAYYKTKKHVTFVGILFIIILQEVPRF
jgi:hypothetical protein